MTPTIRKLANLLLGLMTVFSFGGALAIWLTIRGGGHDGWPPDRPIEWWVFLGVTGAVVVLFGACLVVALRLPRGANPPKSTRAAEDRDRAAG